MHAEGPAHTARAADHLSAYRRDALRAALARAASRCTWMIAPVVTALTVRVMLFVAADAGARLMAKGHISGALDIWNRMDVGWYLGIAQGGYTYSPVGQSRANFFPLYPLAIWLTHHVTGFLPGQHGYLLAGMLVSWLAFLAACAALYRLVLDRFDQSVASGSVLLLAVFPFSFFFGAAYSESLYLLLALLAFLGIERRRWWPASIAALLAGAERPPGLIVGACVIVAYALDWRRTHHPLRLDLAALLLTPLGAIGYAVYCWWRFGDPAAYVKASSAGWKGGHLQLSGIGQAATALIHEGTWLSGSANTNGPDEIAVLILVLVLLSLVPTVRLLGLPYALYALASAVSPLATFTTLNSLGRYLSVIFPAFIVLAYLLRHHPPIRDLVLVTSAALLGIFTVLFVAGFGIA